MLCASIFRRWVIPENVLHTRVGKLFGATATAPQSGIADGLNEARQSIRPRVPLRFRAFLWRDNVACGASEKEQTDSAYRMMPR